MVKKITDALQRYKPMQVKNFLLSNEGNLKQKVIRGGFWAFALRVFRRGFEFARTIVLARLLSPNDFGLMGTALLAMSALESFSQPGIQEALIQKQDDIQDTLDTGWTIQVIRGLIISALLFLGAPLVGSFFGEPKAIPLTRVLALSELFKAFTHIGIVFFKKGLDFKKEFLYQITGTFVDVLVSIPAAIILRNPWAIVYGSLAGNLSRLVISHILGSKVLRLKLDPKYTKKLLGFGKHIFFQGIILFLINQGDDAFVGRYIGASALGIYQLGYRISNIAATELTHVISSVTFPAYSKIHTNLTKLGHALKRTLEFTAFLSFPVSAAIYSLAPELTFLILGKDWLPVTAVIRILSIEGALRSIASGFGAIYRSTANLKTMNTISLTQLVGLSLTIFPLSKLYGINGVAISVVFMMFLGFCLSVYKVSKILKEKIYDLLKPIVPTALCTVVTVLIVEYAKLSFFNNAVNFTVVTASLAIGVIVYLTLSIAGKLLSKNKKV